MNVYMICMIDFQVSVTSVQGCYRSASFHPHGPLLGTGMATAVVEFWDMGTKVCLLL